MAWAMRDRKKHGNDVGPGRARERVLRRAERVDWARVARDWAGSSKEEEAEAEQTRTPAALARGGAGAAGEGSRDGIGAQSRGGRG